MTSIDTTTDPLEAIKARAAKAREGRRNYSGETEAESAMLALLAEQSSYDVPKLVAALEAVKAVAAEHSARTPFPDADRESQWYSLGKQHGYERVLFEIQEALA